MAAQKGREFVLKISDGASPGSFTTIGGMRSTSFTVNSEQVDITDKDSSGYRELLNGAGVRSISITGSGVFKDDSAYNTIQELALGTSDNQEEFQLVFGNSDILQGVFEVASLEEGGEHNAEQTYSITLESAGAFTLSRA